MGTFKQWLLYMLVVTIFAWGFGCIIVGIIFTTAVFDHHWEAGSPNNPWQIVVGCLVYFSLIVPVVWVLRRKPSASISPGAGQSVTLRDLLADIRQRGDRAIVIDNGGEFMRDFAAADDLVLSPFDARSPGWNLINEIRAPHDWARMARSVIADGHGNDKSWHEMAQTLFANIGTTVGGDNQQLLEIATAYSGKMLEPILDGTSSAILTKDGGERLLTNIRSVFAHALASWQYMPGGDFSLRSYMQGDDRRWLFVPFKESESGVCRALIAAWMDILVSAGLERPEGGQQTWIIIDELDSLGQLSSVISATTKLRKLKVSVVTAFQSASQREELWTCFSR